MGNGFNPPVRKTPDLLRAAKTLCFGTRHCFPWRDLAGISVLTLRCQALYRPDRSLPARGSAGIGPRCFPAAPGGAGFASDWHATPPELIMFRDCPFLRL